MSNVRFFNRDYHRIISGRAAVLDDKERRAKNELIKVNRLKRKQADFNSSFSQQSSLHEKSSSQESLDVSGKDAVDSQNKVLLALIDSMTEAFETAFNTNEVN